ncbi:hypothetical protein BC938DRAFT_481803 [Jimgerdemannia flammicorona]|uniref:Uncharacterized protein n=1 Tax=Jimgerdemannia flammicorona TaxID=994334 RepID=A0A433QFB4_9FUNG|nr:hypothetical protein BC938DRAFT_481803 [Jimgerdemannia flammicorona]
MYIHVTLPGFITRNAQPHPHSSGSHDSKTQPMPQNCCINLRESQDYAASAGGDFASAQAFSHYAPNIVIEPVHLDISLHFDDLAEETTRIKVITTFRHSRGELIESVNDRKSITLNGVAFEDLTVTTPGVSHAYDGEHLKLVWDTPFNAGEDRHVTVEYKVKAPIAGLYFSKPDSFPIGVKWAITDHETEKARYWLACVDFPTVRTTLTWHITAPAELTSLANGRLESEDVKDGFKTTHWKLDHRCPSYLICFAVGQLIEYDDGEVDGIPIKYYTAKGNDPQDLHRSFGRTPEMIKWLQKKIDYKFPWPKYYQIALPGIGGAMENISLVTWTDTLLIDETLATERKAWIETINIHEMAHTYFGDLLVIRFFEHAWLKESWATYIEACWVEDLGEADEYRYQMYLKARNYIFECGGYMRPIVCRKYDSSWDLFDSHTYPGGCWRLHMLRHLIGTSCFWRGVHRYVRDHAGKTVVTHDLQTALETESGVNLTRFFDQFIYSKGYPRLKGNYDYSRDSGNRVRITLSQQQQDDAAGIPLFAFPVDVEIVDDAGGRHVQTIMFDREARQVAVFFLPERRKPARVRVDPQGKVLHTLEMSADEEILENVAAGAEDVVSRMWAYAELVKIGTRGAIKKVGRLVAKEKFYGVKIKVAQSLAAARTAIAIDLLAELISAETDPQAMSSVVDAASGIRDPVIRDAVLKLLTRENLPAHGSALAVLGAQKNPDDLSYLLQVAKDDTKIGQHGIVRSSALMALGLHRSEEAFQYLLNRVGYRVEPLQSRPAAISALAGSADWQEKRFKNRAIEVITNLLRDPDRNVRISAVNALVSLDARGAQADIASVRSTIAANEHSWLDRRMASLRAGPGGEKAHREQIERLEERVRKLESRLAEKEAKEKEEEEKK